MIMPQSTPNPSLANHHLKGNRAYKLVLEGRDGISKTYLVEPEGVFLSTVRRNLQHNLGTCIRYTTEFEVMNGPGWFSQIWIYSDLYTCHPCLREQTDVQNPW